MGKWPNFEDFEKSLEGLHPKIQENLRKRHGDLYRCECGELIYGEMKARHEAKDHQ